VHCVRRVLSRDCVNYSTFARNNICLLRKEVSNGTKKKHTARCPLGEPRIYPIEICTTWIVLFLILRWIRTKCKIQISEFKLIVSTRRHCAWENQTWMSVRHWELRKGCVYWWRDIQRYTLIQGNFLHKFTWLLRELGIQLFKRVHKSAKSDC
jgi:hypothetical protein